LSPGITASVRFFHYNRVVFPVTVTTVHSAGLFPQTAFRKLLQEKNLVLTSAERASMIPKGEIEAVQPWNRHLSPAMLCREAWDHPQGFAIGQCI